MLYFEILQSVQRVVVHCDEKPSSRHPSFPKFSEVPESVLVQHDSNRFKMPHYNKNYFLKDKNSNDIILKSRLPLRSLPTGMDVTEYSGFFAEALADSCCSDHAEKFSIGTDKIVKNSYENENILFYDAMRCYYIQHKIKHEYKRWQVDISGLISGDFESLLSRCLIEKCEKSISFEFKLLGDDGDVFIKLLHPEPVILYSPEVHEKQSSKPDIISAVKISISFEHQETSEAIKCHCKIKDLFEIINSRKPFAYLKL